ncbi:MAG: hypothetical protein GY737_25940 [Desulfobacteraceae bacterium]|nr:hypothetical protein [Desulfobacteraceae bacterium]
MIIEITGVPGSGKTTIINQLIANPKNNCTLFSPELICQFLHMKIFPLFVKKIISDIFLVFILACNLFKYKEILFVGFLKVMQTNESLIFKLNIFRNIMLKIAGFEAGVTIFKKKRLLFDEGISHIPFNLADYTNFEQQTLTTSIKLLAGPYSNVNLLLIDHCQIDIVKRLKCRGHKRLLKGGYDCQKFVDTNHEIFELMNKNSDKYKWFCCWEPTSQGGINLLIESVKELKC